MRFHILDSSQDILLQNLPMTYNTPCSSESLNHLLFLCFAFKFFKLSNVYVYLIAALFFCYHKEQGNCYSPSHVTPSPLNPSLHTHIKPPSVFMHIAFVSWQLSVPSVHSSISVKRVYCQVLLQPKHKATS